MILLTLIIRFKNLSDADRPDSFKKWGKDLGYADEQLITLFRGYRFWQENY